MSRCWAINLAVLMLALPALAQGVANDLLAGKLVDPEVGQWAWYDLTAPGVNMKYVIRQAIVGEEKVGRKDGYWVEVEVIPEAGFNTVYKMLLAGPASEPKNIHQVILKQGNESAREMELANPSPEGDKKTRSNRKSIGLEKIDTLSGPVQAEHIELQEGNRTVHLWVNEAIKPTGIVKLQTSDGEMVLRNSGIGGDHAKSAITEKPLSVEEAPATAAPEPEIVVK